MKFDFSRNPENCAWMRRNDKNVKFYFQKNVYFTLFLNSGLTLESPETAAPVFSPRAVKSESSGDRPGQPHIVKNTSYLRCFSLQPSLSTGLGTNPYLSKSDFFFKDILLLPCILHYPTKHKDITKLCNGLIFVFEHLELPHPSASKCFT